MIRLVSGMLKEDAKSRERAEMSRAPPLYVVSAASGAMYRGRGRGRGGQRGRPGADLSGGVRMLPSTAPAFTPMAPQGFTPVQHAAAGTGWRGERGGRGGGRGGPVHEGQRPSNGVEWRAREGEGGQVQGPPMKGQGRGGRGRGRGRGGAVGQDYSAQPPPPHYVLAGQHYRGRGGQSQL